MIEKSLLVLGFLVFFTIPHSYSESSQTEIQEEVMIGTDLNKTMINLQTLENENTILRENNTALAKKIITLQVELDNIRKDIDTKEDIKTALNFTGTVLDFLSSALATESNLIPDINTLQIQIHSYQNNQKQITREELDDIISKTQIVMLTALQDETSSEHKMILSNLTNSEYGLQEIKKEIRDIEDTVNDPTSGIKAIFDSIQNSTNSESDTPNSDPFQWPTVWAAISATAAAIGLIFTASSYKANAKAINLQVLRQVASEIEILEDSDDRNSERFENFAIFVTKYLNLHDRIAYLAIEKSIPNKTARYFDISFQAALGLLERKEFVNMIPTYREYLMRWCLMNNLKPTDAIVPKYKSDKESAQ